MGWVSWSKEEERKLIEHYSSASWDELLAILPGRTQAGISGKAGVMGIKRIPKYVQVVRRQMEGTRYISIGKGQSTLVDEEDYDWLQKFSWYLHGKYVRGSIPLKEGGAIMISIHRLILNAPPHLQVDHINHDSLDNRRMNLRLCYPGQNLANQSKGRGQSRYKGVHPRVYKGKIRWQAYIQFEGHQSHLGFHDTEEEAARAYDRAASSLFGEFANLNFSETSS